jgi:seryl-tRNA synthetase
MSNRSFSYAEQINDTKVMLAGLKAQIERLGKRGVDNEFITGLEEIYNEVRAVDNDQEAMKARQKEISVLLREKMKELRKRYSLAKKVVKMEMPQESWKEFGIKDKH